MTAPARTTSPSSLLARIARRLRREMRRPFKPLLHAMRDRQAPSLHQWMHESSVPMTLSTKSALIVAPHPDDETFGCGGVIAMKRDAGVDVHVLMMTDGRQSHSHIPGVDPRQMEETRKKELLAACRILGVPDENIHFLNLADQGVYRLSPEQQQKAAADVASIIRSIRPGELFVNHPTDRHPDHEAVYRLVDDALQQIDFPLDVFKYPIWLIWKGPYRWTRQPVDLKGASRLDVRGVQERKNKAINVYASQLPVLPPGFVDQFTGGFEYFFR
ncbi:MAG TPA: PIG-L deacetylase family protein [Humisphaera sp.]|jgi:LmbE family N-acetylglucosaminyl deacetylase|nr:PIG-L deacetylase family protein [Humisphaera sp.]